MKTSILCALVIGALVIGCSKNNNDTTNRNTIDTGSLYPREDTGAYKNDFAYFKAEAQRNLQLISDSVSAYGSRVKAANGKRKALFDSVKVDLDKRFSDLNQRLTNYKDEGIDKFNTFRSEFNRSFDSLKERMKQLY